VTDLPIDLDSVPAHLGVRVSVGDDGWLSGTLETTPAICDRGTVPAYAVLYLVDVVAGVSLDDDPDSWSFTSDASVRAPLVAPPPTITCTAKGLRRGARSSTCEVPLLVDGGLWGHSFIGFSKVPRRPGDPPKPAFERDRIAERMNATSLLDAPLRVVAGFRTVDASCGVVSAELRSNLLNPAGAMQGGMVAGLAEAAAEDLADHLRLAGTARHVVTELDVRYLAQARVSPIVTRAWAVGSPADGLVRVDLVDDGGTGRITTSVLARVRPAPV